MPPFFIGFSLLSGTSEAFLFDTLKILECEKEYGKFFSRAQALTIGGSAIAAIFGGYIATYSMTATFLLSSAAYLVIFFVMLSAQDTNQTKSGEGLKILLTALLEQHF